MNWRSILGGALGLIVLEVLVTSPNSAGIGGLVAWPAKGAKWLIDPTVPAIPDRTTTKPA